MEQLAWLPLHDNLSRALTEARHLGSPAERLAAAVALSGYRRDFTAAGRIDRLTEGALEDAEVRATLPNPGLQPFRLAILSSHTVDQLVPSIRVSGLQRRLALSIHVAPYGQYRQSLLMDDPQLKVFAPQLILLALDARDAPIALPLEASEEDVDAAVAVRVSELRNLWRRARDCYTAQVAQQTLIPMDPPIFGGFEGLVPASPYAVIERLNTAIRKAAGEEGVLLLDLAWQSRGLDHEDGLADPVRWHQGKQLISPMLAPFYGDLVARIAAGVAGLSRKCLVLDLDNTLWGGVIGDDGVDGIKLGEGSPTGEAFLAVQRYVAALGRRGVILAVCSKNDMAVAEGAFANHSEMALKRSDIACFVANWSNKADNLRHIAKTLNIGIDSLVFVDDNPAERSIVRRELPEVAVPELPADAANYTAVVGAAGYFEAVSFTADDTARARAYALNAERAAAMEQATDMDGYLQSLEMTMVVTGVGPAELPRVTQLTNKTNQFNLTTRRYTEPEVQKLADDPKGVALALRLKDRFGDNGLISVVIARPDTALPEGELLIDTWLMSCRVLGRQAEQATLGILAEAAANRGAKALIGEFRPSAKNGMVAEHYPRLGFVPADAMNGADPNATYWRYDLPAATPTHHIKVQHQ